MENTAARSTSNQENKREENRLVKTIPTGFKDSYTNRVCKCLVIKRFIDKLVIACVTYDSDSVH